MHLVPACLANNCLLPGITVELITKQLALHVCFNNCVCMKSETLCKRGGINLCQQIFHVLIRYVTILYLSACVCVCVLNTSLNLIFPERLMKSISSYLGGVSFANKVRINTQAMYSSSVPVKHWLWLLQRPKAGQMVGQRLIISLVKRSHDSPGWHHSKKFTLNRCKT